MSFWKWSKTANSNATADPSINWAEGQAPSSINDSARGMMAAAAKYRDDITGSIITIGTGTDYALASNQQFDTLAHMDQQLIAFRPHTTNTGAVTLNVDGLGAKPVRGAPGVSLPSGTLIQGTPYLVSYNNSDGVHYLINGTFNSYGCPVAGGMVYFTNTAPNSAFAFPFGQAISRSVYSALYSLIGTGYGAGDGATTFNLPDMRGRFFACADNMGGAYANILPGGGITAKMGAASVALSALNLPAHAHSGSGTTSGHSNDHGHTFSGTTAGMNSNTVHYHTGYALGVYSPSAGGGSGPGAINNGTYQLPFQTSDANIDHSHNFGGSTSGVSANHTHTYSFTTDGGPGSAVAFSIIPPTLVANYIMRII